MAPGICLTQVTQLVAQNFTSTTLPRRSCMLNVLPSMVVKATSGALGAGRQTNQAPMPAATRTARVRTSFFMGYLIGMTSTPPTALPSVDSMGARLGDDAFDEEPLAADELLWPDRRRASSRLMVSKIFTTLVTPLTSEAAAAA